MDKHNKLVEWTLRITTAGTFLGHGVLALGTKAGWFEYFEAVGMNADQATALLPWIGAMDVVLAVLVLFKIVPILLLWMIIWSFWTALLRPIAGEPIWDFVERFANFGAPLALFFMHGFPKTTREWFGFRR